MIGDLLKEFTSYNLANLCQMVVNWVKTQIGELVKEEMGLNIKVKQNDFKAMIEQFTQRYQKVATKLDDTI